MTPDRRPSHEHRARVHLPDWMRDPPPPRRTPARLLDDLIERRPALRAARRAIWRWRDRTRWSESHPNLTAVASFFVVAVATTALLTGTYYLLALIVSGEI